jgi:putative ABC transport system ATP-binding protein
MVALSHRQDAFPSTLSGGELQRMAVARATVTRPALLLCDEPTGNLDSANSTRVMSLITDVLTGDSAVVLVTHDQSLREHAARVVRVVDGRVDEGPR